MASDFEQLKSLRIRQDFDVMLAEGVDQQEPPGRTRRFEAGITDIVAPYLPRWTGETIQASSESDAIEQLEQRGFYRNLVVREVLDAVS